MQGRADVGTLPGHERDEYPRSGRQAHSDFSFIAHKSIVNRSVFVGVSSDAASSLFQRPALLVSSRTPKAGTCDSDINQRLC